MKSHYISMKKVKDPLGFELETFRLQVKYQTHYATVSYISHVLTRYLSNSLYIIFRDCPESVRVLCRKMSKNNECQFNVVYQYHLDSI